MESSLLLSLKTLLAPYTAPWWVAGGWAVDAHVGHVTRQHDDADVLVLQRDLHLVAATFPDVYAEVPGTGERLAWDGVRMLDPGPQALGLNVDLGDGISKVQLLIALTDGEEWVYHRGRRNIRRPLGSIGRTTADGVPYLTPEIVLLFKSRGLREKDTADFIVLEPLLSYDERHWLRERIRGWRPDHPWLHLFTAAASE